MKCGYRGRATYNGSRLRQKQAFLKICFKCFRTPSLYQTSRSENVLCPAHIFMDFHVQQLPMRQSLNVGRLEIQACLVYRENIDCTQSIWLESFYWIIERLLQAL